LTWKTVLSRPDWGHSVLLSLLRVRVMLP